jgi:hypothetical protein
VSKERRVGTTPDSPSSVKSTKEPRRIGRAAEKGRDRGGDDEDPLQFA